MYDAVRFKLPQLLAKHLLGDVRNRALQLRKAHHLAAEQVKQDHQFPSDARRLKCYLQGELLRELKGCPRHNLASCGSPFVVPFLAMRAEVSN
jgi:hypothetical protein